MEAIAEEIADYLRAHPKSADTLEGVVQWWLLHQRYLRGLSQVQAALDTLVDRGIVKTKRIHNGKYIYLYNRTNHKN